MSLLVAAFGHRAELVVVPVLTEYVFDVTELVASNRFDELVSAFLAKEDAEPDDGVSCPVFFTIYTERIERNQEKFLEVLSKLWALLHL